METIIPAILSAIATIVAAWIGAGKQKEARRRHVSSSQSWIAWCLAGVFAVAAVVFAALYVSDKSAEKHRETTTIATPDIGTVTTTSGTDGTLAIVNAGTSMPPTLPDGSKPPRTDSAEPATEAIAWTPQGIYLSQKLELARGAFPVVYYQPFTSHTKVDYQRGLVLSAPVDGSSAVITYTIPPAAKMFTAAIAANDYSCDCSSGGCNGWEVYVTTPTYRCGYSMYWNSGDQAVTLPVDDIPATELREIMITISPNKFRTCDHPAVGNPRFVKTSLPVAPQCKKK